MEGNIVITTKKEQTAAIKMIAEELYGADFESFDADEGYSCETEYGSRAFMGDEELIQFQSDKYDTLVTNEIYDPDEVFYELSRYFDCSIITEYHSSDDDEETDSEAIYDSESMKRCEKYKYVQWDYIYEDHERSFPWKDYKDEIEKEAAKRGSFARWQYDSDGSILPDFYHEDFEDDYNEFRCICEETLRSNYDPVEHYAHDLEYTDENDLDENDFDVFIKAASEAGLTEITAKLIEDKSRKYPTQKGENND